MRGEAEGRRRAWRQPWPRSSWPAAILAVSSILLPPATGLSVTWEPEHPVQGGSVTLTPQGLSGSFMSCSWFRASTTDVNKRIFIYYSSGAEFNGTGHSGRETRVLPCSLRISDLMSNDSGIYTVSEESANLVIASANITVSENLTNHRPDLKPTDAMVAENGRITLECHTSKSDSVSVFWFKDGKPLLAVTGLSDRNRILNIIHITRKDAGDYTCQAKNPVSNAISNPSKITVAYGPDIKLNQEGSIEQQIGSTLALQCTVDSVPAAQLQWLFNNTQQNNIGSEYTAKLDSWEDEGNYTCYATNPYTNLNNSVSVYVKLTKATTPFGSASLSTGAIAGIVLGTLAVAALVGGLLYLFLRAHVRSDQTSGRTVAAPSIYENIFPPGQGKAENSSDPNQTYETLQHKDWAVYDQLKW